MPARTQSAQAVVSQGGSHVTPTTSLQLLAEGRSMKEAGYILNISARTVAFHKYCMMREFQIRSNAELFRLAARQHVVTA